VIAQRRDPSRRNWPNSGAAEAGHGLVTVEQRLGYEGPLDLDVHPTNAGHSFAARAFEAVWNSLR